MKNTQEIAVTDFENTRHRGTVSGAHDEGMNAGLFSVAGANLILTVLWIPIFGQSPSVEFALSMIGSAAAVVAPLGYFVGRRHGIKKGITKIVGGGVNYKILRKDAKQMRTSFASAPVKVIPLQVEGSTDKFHLIVEGKNMTVRERSSDEVLWEKAFDMVRRQYEISEDSNHLVRSP